MSKERELLKALKDSIDKDPYANSEAAQEGLKQAATPGGGASTPAADLDMSSLLEFFNSMGTSMMDDPMFYLKLTGLLIIGVLILLVAFELIIGS